MRCKQPLGIVNDRLDLAGRTRREQHQSTSASGSESDQKRVRDTVADVSKLDFIRIIHHDLRPDLGEVEELHFLTDDRSGGERYDAPGVEQCQQQSE